VRLTLQVALTDAQARALRGRWGAGEGRPEPGRWAAGATGEWRSDVVWRAIISSSTVGMTRIEGSCPAGEILGPPRQLARSRSAPVSP
jgi:hypothetical protein